MTKGFLLMKHFIIYSRQSKISGLEGQMTLETADFTIKHYLKTVGKEGLDYKVVGSFEEVQSGFGKKAKNREEFSKAVELCYKNKDKYTLLVSNISRLSRNTALGAKLVEDLDIVVASNPLANNTMKNLMLVMAEEESSQQSIRRTAAAEAKRERCKKNGEKFIWGGNSPKWKASYQSNRAKGLHKKSRTSIKAAEKKKPIVEEIKKIIDYSNDSLTYEQISDKLNAIGVLTTRGNPWIAANVCKFIKGCKEITYRPKNKK